ncbi:MAG: alanyl aminopeptidase [Kiritimatiellia bacterium]|jgi:alanyl aminopeptidase
MYKRVFLFLFSVLTLFGLLTAPSSAQLENGRLPGHVQPIEQSLQLRLDPAADIYSGMVEILLQLKQASSSVWFHARDCDIRMQALTQGDQEWSVNLSTNAHGLVEARFSEELPRGKYRLRLAFERAYERRGTGLYKTESGGDAYLFTQMEPEFARQAFPCFDEPGFKIPWKVELRVPTNMTAFANMPVAEEKVVDGLKHLTFQKSPPLPSYLVAFAVGPFESVAVEGMSVPGRIIAPRGQLGRTRLAAEMTPKVLKPLEAYFGIDYPYEKLDQIAVPEFNFGAMENPGLITYRDSVLLLDADHTAIAKRRGAAMTITHELAHMWFGNLVTPRWWNDIWLNESFATWMARKITAEVYPEFDLETSDLRGRRGAMDGDMLASAKMIRREVDGAYDKTLLFDGLSYSKGGAILGMIENWMGADDFRAGMRQYMEAHEWSNADAFDLAAAMEDLGGEGMNAVMKTFTTQPGVPLVKIERVSDNQLKLTQERYAMLSDETPYDTTWTIPVVIRYSSGRQDFTQRILLTERVQYLNLEIPLSLMQRGVFYPNADARGYYLWTLAGDKLADLPGRNVQQLSVRERLDYLDNLSAQVHAGALASDAYLNALRGFRDDAAPEVITDLAGKLEDFTWDFIHDGNRTNFGAFVRATLGPALERIGRTPSGEEKTFTITTRAKLISILGQLGRDASILEQARTEAERFLDEPAAVDADLVSVWIRLAALEGDQALYDRYRAAFESTEDPVVRQYLNTGLAAFEDPTIHDQALGYSLTDKVKPQEWGVFSRSSSGMSAQRKRVFDWYRRHFDAIKVKVPEQYICGHTWMVAGRDEDLFRQGETFFMDEARRSQGIEREFGKVQDVMRQRLGLIKREQARVDAFLAE